jgi:hypothetical protein
MPCPDGEYCGGINLDGGDIEGCCTELPSAGEPCVAVAAAPPCAPGLRCGDDDLCHGVARLDGTCLNDDGCASENREAGTCQVPQSCAIL